MRLTLSRTVGRYRASLPGPAWACAAQPRAPAYASPRPLAPPTLAPREVEEVVGIVAAMRVVAETVMVAEDLALGNMEGVEMERAAMVVAEMVVVARVALARVVEVTGTAGAD